MSERRRFLVVVRCGDSSLHPSWLSLEGEDRNWDLHLSYFGSVQGRYAGPAGGKSISFEKGSKFLGLDDYLTHHLEDVQQYDYVAFPDDDLQFSEGNWSKTFDIIAKTEADLGQPSLDRRSYFAHGLVLRRSRFLYRQSDFVEVMAPVFKVSQLLEIRKHFTLNKSSWGLDYIWSHMIKTAGGKMVVVDACAVLHTRRVGKGAQYAGNEMNVLYDELTATMKKYDVEVWLPKAIAGFTEDGKSSEPLFLINRMEILPRVYKRIKDWMKINLVAI